MTKVLTILDLADNPVSGLRVENLGSFPAAGSPGRLVFNTGSGKLGVDDGASFLPLSDDGHGHAIADVTGMQAALDGKAPSASPSFTGTPTAPTAASGTNDGQVATTAFVQDAVSNAGGGDMLAADYDVDGDGVVNQAQSIANQGVLATRDTVTIGEVSGLQTELDAKAASGHAHSASEITDLNAAIAAYIAGEAGAQADLDTISEMVALIDQNRDNLALQVKRYAEDVGDGTATTFTVTHGMNTRDAIIQVYDTVTFEDVLVDVARPTVNTVGLTFAVPPAANAYRVVILA